MSSKPPHPRMSVGAHVRKVVSEAPLPQDTFPKERVGRERGFGGVRVERGGEVGSGRDCGDLARELF
eukprot:scaffold6337_cov112-Isochrysis_galbana.AAC.2